MIDEGTRGIRIPFWVWLVILVVLVLAWWGAGQVREAMGRKHLRQTLDGLRAAGRGTTVQDLLAELPAVDADRQERAWAFMQSWTGLKDPQLTDAELEGLLTAADAPKWRAYLESAKPLLAQWSALTAEGPLRLDASGWLRQDVTRRGHAGTETRVGQLLNLRLLFRALKAQALLEADPTPALDAWQALDAALADGTLIDVMIAIAHSNDRDQTHLLLARLGRLPDACRDRWLATRPDWVARVARAFRWERLSFGDHFVAMALDGSLNQLVIYDAHPLSEPWQRFLHIALDGLIWPRRESWGDDLAFYVRNLDLTERHVAGETVTIETIPDRAQFSRITVPNLLESAFTAVQHLASSLRARLAVRLISDCRRGLPLPADTAGLEQRYGAGCLDTPRGPRHVYERIDERRFRIAVPATAPAAAFFDPRRVSSPRPRPKGAPKDADLLDPWSLEITVREPQSWPR